jgi:ClpP class serine protease
MNDSKKMEMEGYERTFITSGSEKVPFAADGSFRKEFLEDIQYKVDKLYENFTSYVAEHRGMTVEAVKATEAKTYLAQDAVDIGLADKVMTIEEFYGYIAEQSQQRETPAMKNKLFKFTKKEDTSEMMKLEEMQAAMSELQAALGAKEEMLAGYVEQMAAMSSQLQEKEEMIAAAVAKAQEAEAASEAAKKEMKLKDRTAALAATMPTEAAATMAASLEALDEQAFASVLAGFSAQAQALQASDLFTQMSTSVDSEQVQQEAAASVDAASASAVAATREAMKARGI